ncbi:MAG: LysM domain-containing protein [Bacteroidales bacterium]|jgi:hypothetical protein|nr:LysM domain-containing protein [Bacteroidales bacterium]
MRTINTQERQTLFDIAIMQCGDVEAAFAIMQMNDLSVTEELQTGQEISVPDTYNRRITEFYSINSINPATAYIAQAATVADGIVTNDNTDNLITNDNTDLIVTNNG